MADTFDDEQDARRDFGIAIRVITQALLRLREITARRRADERHRAQQESGERRRQLESRMDAEQKAAEAQLQAVFQPAFFADTDEAATERIARTYDLARSWSEHSPIAGAAAATIRREIHDRTGIDLEAPPRDATTENRADAQRERQVVDTVVAAEDATTAVDDVPTDQHRSRDPKSDLNLRDVLIESGVDTEAVDARMTALQAFPLPACSAVTRPPTPRIGKRGRSQSQSPQRERGLER